MFDCPSLMLWMRENIDSYKEAHKEMKYLDAAIKQMIFFRDRIATLFLNPDCTSEERENCCYIENWHKSKSVDLPVYLIDNKKILIVARDNFYNWNVTVSSSVDIELPEYFDIDASNDYLFMEGMECELKGKYAESKQKFSFCVWDDYTLFAIMWNIASQVRNKDGK